MGIWRSIFGSGAAKGGVTELDDAFQAVDFVAVDVETACSAVASICQIGIVGFADGRVAFEYQSLIDPKHPFDDFNVALHGIDSRKVRGSPCFRTAMPVLDRHLGDRDVVGHSAFDRRAITAAAAFHGVPAPRARWHDSVVVARRVWPEMASHKLNLLAERFGIALDHHDALSDARAAGLVVVRAMQDTGKSLTELTAPLPKASLRRTLAPTGEGGLSGHVVVLTGELSVPRGEIAARLAAAGAKVSSTVSRKTTILVVGRQDPAQIDGKAGSAKELAAAELIEKGQRIEVIDEASLLLRLA